MAAADGGALTPPRRAALAALGVVAAQPPKGDAGRDVLKDAEWERAARALARFVEREGNAAVPHAHVEPPPPPRGEEGAAAEEGNRD